MCFVAQQVHRSTSGGGLFSRGPPPGIAAAGEQRWAASQCQCVSSMWEAAITIAITVPRCWSQTHFIHSPRISNYCLILLYPWDWETCWTMVFCAGKISPELHTAPMHGMCTCVGVCIACVCEFMHAHSSPVLLRALLLGDFISPHPAILKWLG